MVTVISFRYMKVKNANFPKIPLTIFGADPSNSIDTAALLDSGATSSFFPLSIIESIGARLEGEPEEVNGWKDTFFVRTANIRIDFGKGREQYRLTKKIFVPVETGKEEEIILGRDFFQEFIITFKEAEKIIEISKFQPKPFSKTAFFLSKKNS